MHHSCLPVPSQLSLFPHSNVLAIVVVVVVVVVLVLVVRAARKLAVANRIARRQQIHTAAFLNWKQVPPE